MTGANEQIPLSVLVVDDDQVWRRIICHTVNKHGAIAHGADSLAAAVDTLALSSYDIVMLDYELPDGRGLDLFDRCPQLANGRVILITGYADVTDLNDRRAVRAEAYLTKPFLSSDLVAVLRANVGEPNTTQQSV